MKDQMLDRSLQRLGNDIEEDAFARQENRQPHNTHELADYLLEQFFTLPAEELAQILPPRDSQKLYTQGADGALPGRLADDPFRSQKNLIISMLIILTYELQQRFPTDYEIITTVADACVREVERAENDEELYISMKAAFMTMKRRILGNGRASFYHPIAKQAKDYIYQNLHQKIDLGELAKKLGTSQSYLSQVFRKYEGMTPQQFILKERLHRAENLLVYTDRTVEEICHSLGFSTTSYFGKCLKTETGLTPVQYREKFSEKYREKTTEST